MRRLLTALTAFLSLVMPLVSSESSARQSLQSRRLRPRSNISGPAPTPDEEAIIARHSVINRKVQLALANINFKLQMEYCLQMISDFGVSQTGLLAPPFAQNESEERGWTHLNLDDWNRCIDMMDLDPRQKFDPLFLENLKLELRDHMRRKRLRRYNDDDTYDRPLYFSNAKPDTASEANKARTANPFSLENFMKVLKSTQWPKGLPVPKRVPGKPMLMRPG